MEGGSPKSPHLVATAAWRVTWKSSYPKVGVPSKTSCKSTQVGGSYLSNERVSLVRGDDGRFFDESSSSCNCS